MNWSNGLGIAMAVIGFIAGALNYVTVLKTYNDAMYGEDNVDLTLSLVTVVMQALYVPVMLAWLVETF